MNNGRTHWDGCWREHRAHHALLTALRELRAENERLRSRLAEEEGKTSAALEAAAHLAEKNSALKARLAEAERDFAARMEKALQVNEQRLDELSDCKARLAEAERWIESAHQVGCSQWPDVDGQVSWKPCDCGRDAFLAGEKP